VRRRTALVYGPADTGPPSEDEAYADASPG